MAIGRPLSFDREQALERVSEVFRERGFEGASMQDLLTATGLSKSSLYQQYGNKQQLFDRCLDNYANSTLADMRKALLKAPSGRAFITAVLEQIITEPQPPRGCLIFNTASDLSQLDPQVAARVRAIFVDFRRIFIAAIKRDQAAGLISSDTPARDMANYLMAAMGGLRTLVKGGMTATELRRSCELIGRGLG